MRARPAVLLTLVLLLLIPGWSAAKEVPYLTGRVNDQANLLTAEQRQRIEGKLEALEQQTKDQIAVLTVESLEGDPIEDFAHRVAGTWKLGTAEKDNGALLLVASGDRKMRIEVGYGLEPDLTDLETNVIQNEVIIPYFKRGDFGGGIEAGVDAMIKAVHGEVVAPAAPAPRPSGGGGGGGGGGFLLFLIFLLFPFSLDAVRSRSWLLYFFLMPFYFFLGYIINPIVGFIALGAWVVLYPILRMVVPKSTARSHRRRGGGGPWIIGGGGFGGGWGGGGGGGWSGGGGGGFSGGGGSFGGGGSSSSW